MYFAPQAQAAGSAADNGGSVGPVLLLVRFSWHQVNPVAFVSLAFENNLLRPDHPYKQVFSSFAYRCGTNMLSPQRFLFEIYCSIHETRKILENRVPQLL